VGNSFLSGRCTADAGEHTHEQFLELYLANISQHTRHAPRTTPEGRRAEGSFSLRRRPPTVDHRRPTSGCCNVDRVRDEPASLGLTILASSA
jgi:hypothetical protein